MKTKLLKRLKIEAILNIHAKYVNDEYHIVINGIPLYIIPNYNITSLNRVLHQLRIDYILKEVQKLRQHKRIIVW